MKKKLTRPKRKQSDVIQFIEGLPGGMISSGKASDLIEGLQGKVVSRPKGKKANHKYLVDLILGLNNNED